MVECCICGKEFKDKHPGRKTSENQKTCSRECYYERLRKYGHWNRGMKWKEMYDKETLEKMEERINTKGIEHWNYERKRTDLMIRNYVDNPQSKEKKTIKLKELPKETLIKIILGKPTNKVYAYQRKAYEKYGRKCMVCGKITGQIDVHHKDKNRNNNELSNLMVLCPKHHSEKHLKVKKNGKSEFKDRCE